jgi:cysteine desulfurase
MNPLYFDYAAATPVDAEVLAAMQPYFAEKFYNPSAVYLQAHAVRSELEQARASVALILGAKPAEVIFSAGGTEANNLAISGVMSQYSEANIVVSAIEHEAVLAPARSYDCRITPVKPDGRIDLAALEGSIDEKTVLVSAMYANNEIGTIEPLHDIAKLVKAVRRQRAASGNPLPLYLHTDACQAANYLHLLVNSLGVDLMTLNAGKIYGPKQCGALFVKTGVKLLPQIKGGGQERGLRNGTENVSNCVGFTLALQKAQNLREVESERLHDLQQQMLNQVKQKLPQAILNGSLEHRLPNNIHLTLPGQDNERLMMLLDERGIQVATGSACSAANTEPSHVLKAIGLSDEAAQSSLRITMGRGTTSQSIGTLIDTLADIL